MISDIKIGDIVTVYHKGYWRVFDIRTNGDGRTLAFYELVLDGNCNKPRSVRKDSCNITWCKKVTKEALLAEIEAYTKKIQRVIDIL